MYKLLNYQDSIAEQDEDTQKRYNLVKKLSKDFTVENEMALQSRLCRSSSH